MGFLGFLKKKKGDSTSSQLELPLPPNSANAEKELPSFSDQEPEEDLKLPEIPELEQQVPESQEMPDFPRHEEIELPERNFEEIAPEAPPVPELEMPKLELPPIQEGPEQESMDEAYKYTPAEPRIEDHEMAFPPFRKKDAQTPGFRTGAKGGDIFISGDDYRNLLEGIETIIRKEKEKVTKQERDASRLEEKEYERFMKIVEDLQRSIIITENNLFE